MLAEALKHKLQAGQMGKNTGPSGALYSHRTLYRILLHHVQQAL
jgi:hypothetical protein